MTLVAVVVPPLGITLAAGLLWGVAFHWMDVRSWSAFYVVCAFGTTIGFHRYFTHKGFEASAPVKATLAILGCMTMQGPLIQWVTDHRKHHALSDQPGDPHSPHVGHGDGALAPSAASCMRTSAGSSRTSGWRRASSTARTSTATACIVWIDRLYVLWVVPDPRPAVPDRLGGRRDVGCGVEAMVWGGLIRIFLYQHATFS